VSDATLLAAFKPLGYNVVLEHARDAKPDGSLSVYCGLQEKPIPYVNIEALHGHRDPQQRMIEAVIAFHLKKEPVPPLIP
jgi:hypothetical protein